MSNWFSKLTQAFTGPQKELQAETKELEQTVDVDRKVIDNVQTASEIKSASIPRVSSTLSPFGSRILEKAKIESLKDGDERRKMTSPAELFLTNAEAKNRVGHIKSIALERSKIEENKYTKAGNPKAETQFTAFMKRNDPKKDK